MCFALQIAPSHSTHGPDTDRAWAGRSPPEGSTRSFCWWAWRALKLLGCLLAVAWPPSVNPSPDCQGRGEEGNDHLVWSQRLLGLLWSSSVSWGSVSLLDVFPASLVWTQHFRHGSWPLKPVSHALWWGGGSCDVLFLVGSQAMIKRNLYLWIIFFHF